MADWKSFWRRLTDYMDKMRRITDGEKLSYLSECLKHRDGQEVVMDAICNGDPFKQVADCRPDTIYNQPRMVFLQNVRDCETLRLLPTLRKVSHSWPQTSTVTAILYCITEMDQQIKYSQLWSKPGCLPNSTNSGCCSPKIRQTFPRETY